VRASRILVGVLLLAVIPAVLVSGIPFAPGPGAPSVASSPHAELLASTSSPGLLAPIDLEVTGQTSSAVGLSWVNVETVTNVTVWFGPTCSALNDSQRAGKAADAQVTGLSPASTFCFAVQAYNASNSSPLTPGVVGSTLTDPSNGTPEGGDPGPIAPAPPHGLPQDPFLVLIALLVVGASVAVAWALSPGPRRGRPT
jgi:hypothetical protein